MTLNEYRFLDRWTIHHPIELVWPRIVDAPAYPAWWGEVYERVTPLHDLPPDCVGSRMDHATRRGGPQPTAFGSGRDMKLPFWRTVSVGFSSGSKMATM